MEIGLFLVGYNDIRLFLQPELRVCGLLRASHCVFLQSLIGMVK